MKHITKFLLFLLLPAALTFQACDKEIADVKTAADEKNVAADTSQSMVSIIAGTTRGYKDGPALQAQFNRIYAVAVADDGTVYIADSTRIRKLKDGMVSTVAGSGTQGCKDGPAKSALFGRLTGIDVAADGSVYVVDYDNNSIRKITTNGTVSTFAGGADKKGYQDGPLKAAKFDGMTSLALGAGGVIYVKETNSLLREGNNLRKISADGLVSTIFKTKTPTPDQYYTYLGIAMTTSPDGTLYYVEIDGRGFFAPYYINSIGSSSKGYEGSSPEPYAMAASNDLLYMINIDYNQITTPNDTDIDNPTLVAGLYDGALGNPGAPEEGPALEVAFSILTAFAWHDNTLYAVDGVKIKKVTLP